MSNLDDKFLEEVGLGSLQAAEKQELLARLHATLEMRVGMRLTDGMSDAQLDEFEALINKQDQAATAQWLATNVPNYQQLVAEELEKLKTELQAAGTQPSAQGGTDRQTNVRDLFTQLGLEKLTDKEKLRLSDDLAAVALDRIASRLEAILTPEQAAQFENLLHTDEKGAFELLEKFVPDYPQIVQEEITLLRSDVVDTQADVMKKLGL